MNNADLFKQIFGIYATELWSMPEAKFLEWLNKNSVYVTNGDMIKALFPTEYGTLNFNIHRGSWLNSPYKRGETDEG